jgi:predicted DNA-binding protein
MISIRSQIYERNVMARRIVSATVDEELAAKLAAIAAETHRKKSYFVNEALRAYFEEIEDCDVALNRKGGDSVSVEEARRELDL